MDVPALNMLVKELIAKHVGGTEFFDALDAAIRDELFFDKLYDLACKDDAYRHIEDDFEEYSTVVSGRFGLALSNWLRGYEFDECDYRERSGGVLLVPGNLRYEDGIIDLYHFRKQIDNERFVFMDDSFFKGRTRDAIKKTLNHYGGDLVHTYVVYDGSETPDPRVTALYRYYDEIGEEDA
ncbi:MAG: hypothetical protein ACXABY_21325 [Candidatus Thorarchaeota archaeon]|jgi:hypothetical protein